MKTENYFIKKANIRKLNRFQEQKILAFGCGGSALLAFISAALSFDIKTKSFGAAPLSSAAIFIAEAAVAFLIWQAVNSQILKTNGISRGLRLTGILLTATIINGNIFCALAGLMLIKKDKNLEYLIGCYMVLVEVLIMIVSYMNVFKPYVCDTFFLGMGVLAVVILIHAVSLPLVVTHVNGNKADKKMAVLAVILMATT